MKNKQFEFTPPKLQVIKIPETFDISPRDANAGTKKWRAIGYTFGLLSLSITIGVATYYRTNLASIYHRAHPQPHAAQKSLPPPPNPAP